MMVLSTAYMGNIQYYSKLLSGEQVVIEAHENYQKQSYRNRCEILSAGGVIALVVPVVKLSGEKMPITQVRIDYTTPWQKQHWRSLTSAYRNSPFFDYYADLFAPFFERKVELLFDFNRQMQAVVMECLGVENEVLDRISLSSAYLTEVPVEADFRSAISRKARLARVDERFRSVPYYQVFSEKMPFCENLSVVDLLFCEGPAAVQLLRESFVGERESVG